ncbi:MAG TPA: hypothetical protein VN982_00440 [Candidatus Dormibacteraeota bacterium]|nr:hypothetical protein [Candidatus Dormibacteraeota bacterium]
MTYKRPIIILVLLTFVAVHSVLPSRLGLDWPSVAVLGIAFSLWLVPRWETLLPFVKTLKVGRTEIELREQADALAISVAKSEEPEPMSTTGQVQAPESAEVPKASLPDDPYRRLVNTNVEAHILDLAAQDKQAALMRLAIEIEKEVLILHGALGLRNQQKARSFREFLEQLRRHGAISNDIREGLLEFWRVRSQIAHSQLSDNSILTSALDSGLRLLRLIKAIPRGTYTVVNPDVELYKDADCREPIHNCQGVIIEIADPQGEKKNMIYPAGRDFVKGERVGWDWDMSKVYGQSYYRNPDTGKPMEAWSSSAAFVGQSKVDFDSI